MVRTFAGQGKEESMFYVPFTEAQRALLLWQAREESLSQELASLREREGSLSRTEWRLVGEGDVASAHIVAGTRTNVIGAIIYVEKALAIVQAQSLRLAARVADEEKGVLWDDPVIFPPPAI